MDKDKFWLVKARYPLTQWVVICVNADEEKATNFYEEQVTLNKYDVMLVECLVRKRHNAPRKHK